MYNDKYKIVESRLLMLLEVDVSRLITEGYTPIGGIVVYHNEGITRFLQAMFKP